MVRAQMRWLKNIVIAGLLVAAAAVGLSALFSDHSDDYGTVALPSGGMVHLPKGAVTVYFAGSDAEAGSGGLAFQVFPATGGAAVPMSAPGGGVSAEGTERSEVIGQHGAIAKLDVPGDGEYRVAASSNLPQGTSSLRFGTNLAIAVAANWKLLAGLVLAAFLVGLIPTPRHGRRRQDRPETPADSGTPTEWSSTHRAPYAG
jgi:hypothetical protein